MSDEPDLQRRRALDRYWDDLVAGNRTRPSDPDLDPVLAEAIRRLQSLAAEPAEDPAFGPRLWEELMQGHAHGGTIPLRPILPGMNGRTNGYSPSRPRFATPLRREPGRVHTALSYAVTAALIAVVLGLLFFVYRDQNNVAIPPAQETPTAAPASPNAGWPTMLGNNQRTATTEAAGPTGNFATLWTFAAPGPLNNGIVSGDAAFLKSEDGSLYCLDRLTGQQRWAFNTGGPGQKGNVLSYPAVAGDTVYAGGELGDVFALDVTTGAVKWQTHLSDESVEASILVQDGAVYTGTSGGLFVALNARDGSERWRFNDGQDFINTFPAFQAGVIYVGGPQSVRAIDAATGTLVWETATDGQVRGAAIDGGVVYAPTAPGSVYALAASDGHQIWQQTFPDAAPALSVAVSGGSLVAGFGTGGMFGLDAETGATVWQTPDSGGQTTASKVSIANGIVYAYFGPRGGILALDVATGQERGFAATEEIRMPPSIVDGVLYAGSGVGIAYAFASEGVASTPLNANATPVAAPTPGPTPTPAPVAATGQSPVRFVGAFSGWDPAHSPVYVSLAPDGKIWVAVDTDSFAIFDLDGNLLETWGTPGNDPGQFDFIQEPGFNARVVWLADGSFIVQDMNGLQLFDATRTFVKTIGPFGDTAEDLTIVVDPDGSLWVGYYFGSRIEHLDASGAKLREFDGSGTPGGKLHGPSYGAIDAQGRLYIPEEDGNRVRIFDRDGNELGNLGANDPAYGGLYRPFEVTIDDAGMIYVPNKDAVDVFNPQWHYVTSIGGTGSGEGQFRGIVGVAVNGARTIFIADQGNNRIQKFAIVGPWPAAAEATPAP